MHQNTEHHEESDSLTDEQLLNIYCWPVYDNEDARQSSFLEACLA